MVRSQDCQRLGSVFLDDEQRFSISVRNCLLKVAIDCNSSTVFAFDLEWDSAAGERRECKVLTCRSASCNNDVISSKSSKTSEDGFLDICS